MEAEKPRYRVPAGRSVTPAQIIAPTRPSPSAGYLRSQQLGASVFSTYAPVLRNADEDVRDAWAQAAGRAVEAVHNSGWISGVVDQMTSLMIGDGLTPNFKPNMTAFGWDQKTTAEWARVVERRFGYYSGKAYSIDAGGRYALGQIQAAVVRQWFGTGEALAEIPMFARAGVSSLTKLRLLPSHWLSQQTREFERLNHGVFIDGHGAPAGYLFEITRNLETTEVRKAARDAYGRPLVVHVFDGQAGQVRGITPMAPVLRVLRDFDQLSNATLTAAMINAIFAATIESDYPTSEVLDALKDQDEQDGYGADEDSRFDAFMGQKVDWHNNVNIDLGRHGKIAHLMPGEKLNFNASETPNANYEAFANFLLREIARCAGALFEDLTGDFRGATYSSIRMGIAKQWPLLLYRRKYIPTPISQAIFDAWLEEEIDSGRVDLPGGINAFVANRDAICNCDWRGPAKPVADEVKAANAHQIYRNMGVVTDEMICSDLGVDHEDIYRGRAAERDMREELNIHGGVTNGGTDMDNMDEQASAAGGPIMDKKPNGK